MQTEQGDIFKIILETDEDMVTEIKLKYFDTVPVASGMNLLKTGFLFVASEFGNHYLYQIAHLGDDDDEPEFREDVNKWLIRITTPALPPGPFQYKVTS